MPAHPLELDGATVRAMVKDVLDRLVPWLDALPTAPMTTATGGHRAAAALRRDWPETGAEWRPTLASLDRALQTSLDTTSPGYLAYIPGGGLPHAAVADLYADLVNRYTGLWMPAPGFVTLEIDVIRWFCEMLGYGPDAGGVLVSGGSLANLGAVVAARHQHLGDDLREGVVYRTGQVHHSVDKAVAIAGLAARNLRAVPVDAAHRMDVGALEARIVADREVGHRPFLVVASAGSTAVGAVDDLAAIADVCERQGCWFHVDAAYGGFFALTERGRETLRGIERADSVALDPHKGLFLPYGTGCLVVRRREQLREAHAVGASYLPPPSEDPLAWDFADLGPELSRPFRGLRVWLPLVLHGFVAFREQLDEKLSLARQAADAIRAMPTVRMVSEPVLSLFAFRAEPEGADHDALNRRWLAACNQRRRVFLTGAVVFDPAVEREVFVIRVCVLSFRTHEERITALIEDLRDAWTEVQARR